MAQPTPYTITTDFSQQEANNASGRGTVNTAALDAEFSNIEKSLGETRGNLGLIQRDDGALRNLSVHLEALSGAVRLLLASGAFSISATDATWLTATAYAPGRVVANGAAVYLCLVSHTSGVFATDLATGKWIQISPVIFTANAANVEFTPNATIGATTTQAAIEEVNSELRPASDLYMASTYGAL